MTLIKKARIAGLEPKKEKEVDILIEGKKILDIAPSIPSQGRSLVNAQGKIVMPAFIDMHVHFRQPGREDKETVETGSRAALAGGAAAVLAMPNTMPAIDSLEAVRSLKKTIKEKSWIEVYIAAAISKKRQGKELVDIKALAKEGVRAITDDGDSIDSSKLMLQAFKQAEKNNMVVICHCEDKSLSKKGSLNLGFSSTCLGLRGISKESEFKRVARDIQLAAQAGAAVHIAHVSCRESVEIIAAAKNRGIRVTAETAPHYFSLSERDLWDFDTNKKINPPLRTEEDVLAIKQALADGTIDVIASDHAPHTENEKDIEFERAEFGTIGLETELAVAHTELVKENFLDWKGLLNKLVFNPAAILGIKKKEIKVGQIADLVIFDPERTWWVEKKNFLSKSKNSCFLGRELKGKIEKVFYRGRQFENEVRH